MRQFLRPIAAIMLALVAACGRDATPTAPTATAGDASVLLGQAPRLTFLACPSVVSYSTTATIGSAGGTIAFGPHSLAIPAGALASPTDITASAPAGDYVRAELQPHGLQFNRKVTLSLSVAGCDALPLAMRIVYVDDTLSILDVLPTWTDLLSATVSTRLKHFSGYMVSH